MITIIGALQKLQMPFLRHQGWYNTKNILNLFTLKNNWKRSLPFASLSTKNYNRAHDIEEKAILFLIISVFCLDFAWQTLKSCNRWVPLIFKYTRLIEHMHIEQWYYSNTWWLTLNFITIIQQTLINVNNILEILWNTE